MYDLSRDTLTACRLWRRSTRIRFGTHRMAARGVSVEQGRDAEPFLAAADGSGALERLTTSEVYRCCDRPGLRMPATSCLHEITHQCWIDIWVLRISDRKTQPFLRTPFNESVPQFSPRRVGWPISSGRTGRFEVYVQPYPGQAENGKSTGGGTEPVWNPTGGSVLRSGGKMMAWTSHQAWILCGQATGTLLRDSTSRPRRRSRLRRVSRRPALPDAQASEVGETAPTQSKTSC